jgi:hypothetical protein
MTAAIWPGEPVVIKTNQGNASAVISVPVVDKTSAVKRAESDHLVLRVELIGAPSAMPDVLPISGWSGGYYDTAAADSE